MAYKFQIKVVSWLCLICLLLAGIGMVTWVVNINLDVLGGDKYYIYAGSEYTGILALIVFGFIFNALGMYQDYQQMRDYELSKRYNR